MLKVTGYFVYYRFINLAIVTPDAYNVVDKELDQVVRKNLVVVCDSIPLPLVGSFPLTRSR